MCGRNQYLNSHPHTLCSTHFKEMMKLFSEAQLNLCEKVDGAGDETCPISRNVNIFELMRANTAVYSH